MKRGLLLFIIGLVSLAVLGLGGCNKKSAGDNKNSGTHQKASICADYPYYDSLDTLYGKATLVIRGKVVSSKSEMLDLKMDKSSSATASSSNERPDHSKLPYTVYTIKVEDVFKGSGAQGETIKVKCLGNSDKGGAQYFVEDSEQFNENSDYVMFLETYDNAPASTLNPMQGAYEVSNGEIIPKANNKITISGLDELRELKNKL